MAGGKKWFFMKWISLDFPIFVPDLLLPLKDAAGYPL